jgi:hypothetical protein
MNGTSSGYLGHLRLIGADEIRPDIARPDLGDDHLAERAGIGFPDLDAIARPAALVVADDLVNEVRPARAVQRVVERLGLFKPEMPDIALELGQSVMGCL